jgi:hypothetical protein
LSSVKAVGTSGPTKSERIGVNVIKEPVSKTTGISSVWVTEGDLELGKVSCKRTLKRDSGVLVEIAKQDKDEANESD